MAKGPCSAISKVLSRNDTGETGAHQAGILVPKAPEILSFFPELDASQRNPRHRIRFLDSQGQTWTFMFIYYNNRFFGGTRNEFRLTCMTPYFRRFGITAGDTLYLRRDGPSYIVEHTKRRRSQTLSDDTLILGTSWKVIRM